MALTVTCSSPTTPMAKSKVRMNARAWARTIPAPEGSVVTVFGERHLPVPRNWWSGPTPVDTAAEKPAKPQSPAKRKASDECSPCEQPAAKRARTACASSLNSPKTVKSSKPAKSVKPVKAPLSRVRTRSQAKRTSNAQVPLATNTSPVPPTYTVPSELRGVVPPFSKSGAHRCGRHKRRACAPKWVDCRDCRQTLPYGSMHILNCGHALCRPCLNDSAARTKAVLACAEQLKGVAECLEKHHAAGYFVEQTSDAAGYNAKDPYGAAAAALSPIALSPSPFAQAKAIVPSAPLGAALHTLGLWCCGMDTDLGQYGDCMEPDNSAALWLVDEVLRAWLSSIPDVEKQQHCAWPDCGSILAPRCIFGQDKIVGAEVEMGLTYAHCVRCSGVSLAVASDVMIPAWSN